MLDKQVVGGSRHVAAGDSPYPRKGAIVLALRFAVLALALAVFPVSAVAAPKPPPGKVIKKLLKKHYLGSNPTDYPAYRYDWRLTAKPSRGEPRLGRYRADGTPPNTRTTVFPIKASSRYTVCEPDGGVRQDRIVAKYVFFRDEFRDWTFRIKDEDRKIGANPPANCPF
jgi:hypothetical protein